MSWPGVFPFPFRFPFPLLPLLFLFPLPLYAGAEGAAGVIERGENAGGGVTGGG